MNTLNVGFFFDGTGYNEHNLEYNTEITDKRAESLFETEPKDYYDKLYRQMFREKIGLINFPSPSSRGSYSVGPSNIVYLFESYPEGKINSNTYAGRVYISGVGTSPGVDDDLITEGAGWSLLFMRQTGVISKTDDAFKAFDALLAKIVAEGISIETITLNIFGFSRGAAVARHFINRINYDEHSINTILEKHFGRIIKVEVNFLGLFDCVAAILALTQGSLDVGDAKTGDVKLSLHEKDVNTIFHITAEHETRYNFALNVNSTKNNYELGLPGSHSDIGGGLSEGASDECFFVSKPYYSHEEPSKQIEESKSYRMALEKKNNLLKHPLWGGIFSCAELEIHNWQDKQFLSHKVIHGNICVLSRKNVQHHLHRISLYAMHKFALNKGVPFLPLEVHHTEQTVIPPDLSFFKQEVQAALEQLLQSPEGRRCALGQKLPDDIAVKYINCECYWGINDEGVQDPDEDTSIINIPNTFLWNVLLSMRPTDNYLRNVYDHNGTKLDPDSRLKE